MNSRWRICFGLAALLGANLFVIHGLMWLSETYLRGVPWTGQAVGGTFFSQTMVLGLWLALGDAKWYWRLAVSAFGTLLLVQTFVWTEALTSVPHRHDDDQSAWVTVLLMSVLLIGAAGLWPLRRVGRWRTHLAVR